MMNPADLSAPLTEAEFHALDEFLLALDHDDAMLDISEFDGFFTAVVSGPDMIPPSVWLPVVWGGEENAPVWDSMEDYQRIFGLMIRYMNSTSATLMQAPDIFEPCFLEREVKNVTYWIVDEWCEGYMKGVELYSGRSATSPDMKSMLAPIHKFTLASDWDRLKEKDHGQIRQLQEQIAPAALAIHAYWLARRTPKPKPKPKQTVTYIRPEAKVGRNDPCPCGSGRKYKKCCGTH